MAQKILRPLEYGDILDEMFDLYKSNFLLLTGVAGIIYLPVNLIIFSLGNEIAQALASFVMAPLSYIVMGAITYTISQKYLGNDVTILGSYRVITKRAWSFIWTLLVAGILMLLGFLLIVPGILLMFRYALISVVFVVEGKSGKQARVRSAELASGQYVRILVLYVLANALATVAGMIVFLPAMYFSGVFSGAEVTPTLGPIWGLGQGLAYTIIAPLQTLAFVLLYYDIRVRKEGFDLELLAASFADKAAVQPAEREETLVQ